jgi:hypothetical protein
VLGLDCEIVGILDYFELPCTSTVDELLIIPSLQDEMASLGSHEASVLNTPTGV